jgi:hypothetical protein
MTLTVELRWRAGVHASCFHATEALVHGRSVADPALSEALAGPATRLRAALQEEGIPADGFFSHLIPLAAGRASAHELAEVSLIKTIGRSGMPGRLHRFWDLLADLKSAFAAVLPRCAEDLAARISSFQGRWNASGIGILGGIVTGTEPGVLVSEATVVLLHPVLGGAGSGYLPYNVATLEAVADDPVESLPEVVRLAWLVSMLNLDLPRYSETIRADRQGTVAALAMIPITLTAAEAAGLGRCDEAATKRAVEAWMPPSAIQHKSAQEWAALLAEWHATYRAMRPPLGTALKGLDVLAGTIGERKASAPS